MSENVTDTLTTELTVVRHGKELFDESATQVRIVDEGAGEFIEVSQCRDAKTTIRIDGDEWPAIRDAVDKMVEAVRI